MLWCGRQNMDIRRSEVLLPAVLQAPGSALQAGNDGSISPEQGAVPAFTLKRERDPAAPINS